MIKRIFFSLLVLLAFSLPAVAQRQQVTGMITEADGTPVVGATIMLDGTRTGTMSDVNGRYTLNLPKDVSGSIRVSCIGYKEQLQEIDGRAVINFVLEVDTSELDEIIVIAFGTSTKESFTGSASVVKSDELSKRQGTYVTSSLAGSVAGVQVTTSSGDPASSSPTILIRGISSMQATKTPLYVVDGAPYTGGINNINPADVESLTVLKDAASTALYGSRGANGVILITTKQAKAGEAKITFDAKWGVNSNGTEFYDCIDDPAQYYEMHYHSLYSYYLDNGISADQAHIRANETMLSGSSSGGLGYQVYTVPNGEYFIGTNGKVNPNAVLGNRVYYDGNYYTLIPDDYTQGYVSSFRQEYNISMSASNDNAKVYASMGFLENNGIVANSNYKRYTGRLRADYQAKKWLKIGGNAAFTHFDSTAPTETSDSNSANAFYFMNTMGPIYPLFVRDGDGNIMYDSYGNKMYDYGDGMNAGLTRPKQSGNNALQTSNLDKYSRNGNSINANISADIKFFEDLSATINLSPYFTESRRNRINNPYYGQYSTSGGRVTVNNQRRFEINGQQLLNYNHTFGEKHRVSVLLGHEFYRQHYYYLYAAKSKIFSMDNNELDGAVIDVGSASSYSTYYNNEGYLSRAEYCYDDRITLSGSYRRDASSRFHPDHRWGNFWSASGAWLINHEKWFKADWVDMLKLKASIGSQGNDGIGDYMYIDTYTIEESDGEISTQFYLKGNEELTWETNTNINVGIDFEFFKGRLGGTIEYYNRRTSDMLNWFSAPLSTGYGGYYDNIGDMNNAGFDLELHFTPVSRKNLTWTINFNMSHVTNKVVSIPDENKTLEVEGYSGYMSGYKFVGEGLPYYTWYIPTYAGVDQTTGESMWYMDVTDEKGNVTRTTTTTYGNATYYIQKTALPDLYGGFSTTLEFFGFDFSASFVYQIGGLSYDYGYASRICPPSTSSAGYNIHKDVLKSWTAENPSTTIPRFQYNDTDVGLTSSRFLIDASYLSLSNITLGYTLPGKIAKKLQISSARVYVVADNVYMWSKRQGLNPSYSYSGSTSYFNYPTIRTISGGVSFKF